MTFEELLAYRDCVDFKCWLDPSMCWTILVYYKGRDVLIVNGGTPDQLMLRFEALGSMSYINKLRKVKD